MKRMALIGIFIMIISILFNYESTNASGLKTEKLGQVLVQAFQTSGAEATGYSVHDWSVMNEEEMNWAQLQQAAEQFNRTLQINKTQIDRIVLDHQRVYQIHGNWQANEQVSIIVSTTELSANTWQSTAVMLVEKQSTDLNDLQYSIEKVRETSALTPGKANFDACIQGFRNDRMSVETRNDLITKVFSTAQAREIEGLRTDLVSSISGYTSLTPYFINTNGKKMNLQVAMHDDATGGKTTVIIGSPIITETY